MKDNGVYEEFMVETLKDEKKLMKIFNWIVRSSVDSRKFALTLKAGVPFLVLLGISDTATLNHLTGSIGELVVQIGQVVTGFMTVWGLLRKVWYSFEE